MLEQMIEWENGELDPEEAVGLFQDLVSTGLAWELQGAYGRTAQRLLDAGLVEQP
jgi:hypothetical protein